MNARVRAWEQETNFETHRVTREYTDKIVAASRGRRGTNRAAVAMRIEYMRAAIRASLVLPAHMERAIRTIDNLARQVR